MPSEFGIAREKTIIYREAKSKRRGDVSHPYRVECFGRALGLGGATVNKEQLALATSPSTALVECDAFLLRS